MRKATCCKSRSWQLVVRIKQEPRASWPQRKSSFPESRYSGVIVTTQVPLSTGSNSIWTGSCSPFAHSRCPKTSNSRRKESLWMGQSASPRGFVRSPGDGWWSEAFRGSSDGVDSVATMRACRKPLRLSSNSRQAIACLPSWFLPSHLTEKQTLSKGL
jgi:hypothetical protein